MNERRTKRQREIDTILTAVEQFFPGVEPPTIKNVCAWLYKMPLEGIISIIEQVAAVDKETPYNNPCAVIWTKIKYN